MTDSPHIGLTPDERFYIDQEGNRYARVTSVIDILEHKTEIAKGKRPELFEEAAEFGTRIHQLTQWDDTGCVEPLEIILDASPELLPWLDNWRRWRDEYVVEMLAVEHSVLSKRFRTAGTIDRVAILKGDKYPSILDIKTGTALGNAETQLAAYRMMYNDTVRRKLDRVVRTMAIHMPRREPGKFKVVELYPERKEKKFLEAVEYYWQIYG